MAVSGVRNSCETLATKSRRMRSSRSRSVMSCRMAMAPRAAPEAGTAPQPTADLNSLIAQAGKDFADYQRLTSEGKLGEAGQKLDDLKHVIEKLNAHPK